MAALVVSPRGGSPYIQPGDAHWNAALAAGWPPALAQYILYVSSPLAPNTGWFWQVPDHDRYEIHDPAKPPPANILRLASNAEWVRLYGHGLLTTNDAAQVPVTPVPFTFPIFRFAALAPVESVFPEATITPRTARAADYPNLLVRYDA